MKVRLLPSNCSGQTQLQCLTSFLINDRLVADAGSLGFTQAAYDPDPLRSFVITHSHSDHTASLPIFIAEAFTQLKEPVDVYSTEPIIEALRTNVFNDTIWPDFTRIKLMDSDKPTLRFVEIKTRAPFEIEGLRLTAVDVNHVVPTFGLCIEDSNSSIMLTSDTYHTDEIWEAASRLETLKAVFVDVSYPNELEELAAASKHLTPQGLVKELVKLKREATVFAVHIKPQHRTRVIEQLQLIKNPEVVVAEIDREYEL